jgi:hypothetical protein
MENGEMETGLRNDCKTRPFVFVRACVRCVCVSTRVAMNRENVELECGKERENKKEKGQRIG